MRTELMQNTSFHVSPSGSDSTGDGTQGNSFKTIQKAWDHLQAKVDLAGFVATIQCAHGTYTQGLHAGGFLVGQRNFNSLILQGDDSDLDSTSIAAVNDRCLTVDYGAQVRIKGFRLTAQNASAVISLGAGSYISAGANAYDEVTGGHVQLGAVMGGTLLLNGENYYIRGSAAAHIAATESAGQIYTTGTPHITILNNPHFSNAFCVCTINGAMMVSGINFGIIGSCTGKKYDVNINSTVHTYGAGPNYFPGDIAGTIGQNGIYL